MTADADRPIELDLFEIGSGVIVVPEPKSPGRYAMILYDPASDQFRIFRRAEPTLPSGVAAATSAPLPRGIPIEEKTP